MLIPNVIEKKNGNERVYDLYSRLLEDRIILLRKIHHALKKGGILILDVFNTPYLNSFQEIQTVKYER